MAETKLDITGSTAVAQQQLDKLTKALAATREEVRKLNATTKESKGATDSWSAGMERLKTQNDRWAQGMAKLQAMQPKKTVAGMSLDGLHEASIGLGKMAAGVFGVGAAVGVAAAAYSRWNQKIDEIVQGHTELSMSIVRTLAEAGKLNMGPEVEKWAKSQKGATPAQAHAALAGVQASGETLSDKRSMAVGTEIAKLAPTGIDLTQAGALSADIADIVGEGVSAEDVADLTVGLKQQLRGKAEQFSGPKMQKQVEHLKRNKKMSGLDSLAYAVAAAQGEVGAEGMKVAAMRPGERNLDQRKMYNDVFAPDKIDAIKADLQRFQSSDLATGELNALGGFQAGREALGEQAVAQESAATQEQLGPFESERSRIRKVIQSRADQKGMRRSAGTYIDQSLSTAASVFVGKQFMTEAEIGGAQSSGLINATEAQQMIAALRESAAASRAVANSNKSRNVDAHTE